MRTKTPNFQYKYDKQVTDYVTAYWQQHYRAPSIRDIATHCQIPSTSQVRTILLRLRLVEPDRTARAATPDWVRYAIQRATMKQEV